MADEALPGPHDVTLKSAPVPQAVCSTGLPGKTTALWD